jgi:hypothetical protein
MLVNDNNEYDYQGDGTSGLTIRSPRSQEQPILPDDNVYVVFGLDYVTTGDEILTTFNT